MYSSIYLKFLIGIFNQTLSIYEKSGPATQLQTLTSALQNIPPSSPIPGLGQHQFQLCTYLKTNPFYHSEIQQAKAWNEHYLEQVLNVKRKD